MIPCRSTLRVIVAGDEMTIDYSGIADQVRGCINSGYYGGGRTTARVAFKYLVAHDEPANEGTFRPLKMILPEGKILSAHPTAPMGNYSQPFPTVIDAIIKALEKALPERVTGAHFGTFSGVRFRGKRANGALFDCHDSGHGGWGACATHDGAGPFRTMAHGDTRIIPVELQESMYPYRLVEFSLREDSAGAGKFRGGLGFRKRYLMLGACDLQAMFDRVKYPPWGVHGGKEGKSGQITVVKKSGETRSYLQEQSLSARARRPDHCRDRRWRRLRRAVGTARESRRTRFAPGLYLRRGGSARLRNNRLAVFMTLRDGRQLCRRRLCWSAAPLAVKYLRQQLPARRKSAPRRAHPEPERTSSPGRTRNPVPAEYSTGRYLHAFGDNLHAENLRHGDDCADDFDGRFLPVSLPRSARKLRTNERSIFNTSIGNRCR